MDWTNIKPISLSKINKVDFPDNKYYHEICNKKQIVIHHTVSGPGIRGDLQTWINSSTKLGTCIIIDRDGTPNQLFSSKYWAWHLGVGKKSLDSESIGIELDNWGQLTKKNDGFYTVYGNKVDVPVTHYPDKFRGEEYFESYTEAQIKTMAELMVYWNSYYKIPLDYHDDMWDVSKDALNGEPGVWTHVSFRLHGKWDCHPQPELINCLKSLKYCI